MHKDLPLDRSIGEGHLIETLSITSDPAAYDDRILLGVEAGDGNIGNLRLVSVDGAPRNSGP